MQTIKTLGGALAIAAAIALPGTAFAQHHHGGGHGGGWSGGHGGGWHGGGHGGRGWVGPAIGLGIGGAVLGGMLAAPYYSAPAAPVAPAVNACWYPQYGAYYACGY